MNNFEVALHPESIISPSAVLLGNITIGKDSSVFPGVIMRGDCNTITIGERTNIQDGAIVHMDYENGVVVGDEVTVGHGAILHGCTIGNRTIVGMGATILDGANVGSNCLIGAGALVPKGVTIPDGSLVMGLPGKVARMLSDQEQAECLDSATRYLKHAHDYLEAGVFVLGKDLPYNPYFISSTKSTY